MHAGLLHSLLRASGKAAGQLSAVSETSTTQGLPVTLCFTRQSLSSALSALEAACITPVSSQQTASLALRQSCWRLCAGIWQKSGCGQLCSLSPLLRCAAWRAIYPGQQSRHKAQQSTRHLQAKHLGHSSRRTLKMQSSSCPG